MKAINVLVYSIKQGFKSLKKNRLFTLASIGTVAACLLIFGLVYFVIGNVQSILQGAENSVAISVFFKDGSSKETIKSIGRAIEARPEVEHVEFISAEEAWKEFKKENFQGSEELIDSFGEDNPLEDSASYEVYIKNIKDQEPLVEYIETIVGVRSVKRSAEVAGGLSSASNIIGVGSGVLILILVLVSIFLINSTISTGIAVRKQEIAIMRLMGASDFFIWAPFIFEGVVIGLIGSVIPLIVLAIAYGGIISYITDKFALFTSNLVFLTTGQTFAFLVPVSLAIGVGIGFLGSFITVRRNMNV
ncbi:MAG: permease-like cell division protein FtsX [Eubacterium sp.]|nr:permease-like cell division protein FtsX [Eubacterium sp.]